MSSRNCIINCVGCCIWTHGQC